MARLTLTAYISGKRKSAQWHREQDSVAAQISVTSEPLVNRILEELDFEETDTQARWQFIDILADAASDDENTEMLDFLRAAGQFTNYIHVSESELAL